MLITLANICLFLIALIMVARILLALICLVWDAFKANELITSMRDDMDEEEYKKRKQEVDNKNAD